MLKVATNSIHVRCQRQNLSGIRRFVETFVQGLQVPDKLAGQLLVAVDEVCANVIVHGNHENPDCYLTVRARRDGNAAVFELLDRGIPFESPPPKTPDLKEHIAKARKGGLGLTLVHLIMDRVEFTRSADGENLTRLIKYI